MTLYTDFLNRRRPALIAAFLILSGCAGVNNALLTNPSGKQHFTIAVFPVENKSAVKAPLREIQQSIVKRLQAQGLAILDEKALNRTLDKHRVRYLGGLDASVSKALQEEAGADAVLITSLELYNELAPPRIALLSRLVSTGPRPEILWSDSVGLAGDDAPGLLGLGLINDPKVLSEKAVGVLTDSLVAFFSGGKIELEGGRKSYAPKIKFRSSTVGFDLLENDVNFVDRTSSGDDRKGRARIAVALTSPSKAPVTVEYAAGSGTIATEKDYELRGNTLTFSPGETRKEIEIEVKNNAAYKDDKTVDLVLKSVKGAALGSTTMHTHTIINTVPPPMASFESTGLQVKETGGAVTLLAQLSAVSEKDVTMPFTVSGTAKTPGNYTITASPVMIKAGAKSAGIVVSPVNNKISEDDKTVVVAMGVPVNATQGKNTVSTVTIADADPEPAVGFTAASSSGEDKISPARLEVSLGSVSGRPVTVEYAVTGGTAVRGKDYSVKEGSLTFAPGETKKEIELGIRNSGIYDYNKTVTVGLTSAKNAVPGGTATHTYTIMNTMPMPAVAFMHASSSGDEKTNPARLEVSLGAMSGKPVTVEYAVTGGTAVRGINYTLKDGAQTVTFVPGETVKTLEIGIRDDGLNTNDKTIEVGLKNPNGAVLGSTTMHTYTILDSDPMPMASFASTGLQVKETGGAVTLLVQLSAVSGKDVTVPFTVSGTAKTPGNYTITPSPLVIKAGAKSAGIVVSPVDNKISEDDKTVVVAMGVPVNATQGKNTVSTVTIADADPEPAVGFTAASSSGEDKISPAHLEVSLGSVSGRPVTVEYAVTGGTAVRGKDYSVKEGSLTFAPGETKKEIELGIRNSGIYDYNKTVTVGLTSAKNAVPGGTATHTYTIMNSNPEPSVAFTVADQRLKKTAGNVHLAVQLSNISGKGVVVPFTIGGSAVQGKDYAVTASPVTVPAGERDAVITIELKEGEPSEVDKTVELKLGNPENAVLGSPNYYRLVLVKDARPTIAVLPFFNTSKRSDAGEILMLQFVKELRKLTDFTVIEPGIVREHLLDMRVIMYEGISSSDIDLITDSVDADLIVTGKVFDYKDFDASWGKPRVNFTVMLISKNSKKVVWSSSSVNSGDDSLLLFSWGEVNTANAMVSEMIESVRKTMFSW